MTSAAFNQNSLNSDRLSHLEAWRLEIIAANDAFIHGQQERAFRHYHAALALANLGITHLHDNGHEPLDEAERQIAAMIVTRHNLADLFQQVGKVNEAVEHLCTAHEAMFQLVHHDNVSIRSLAQRNLMVTYRELMHFIKRHGRNLRVQQTLLMTQYVCKCCRQKFTCH